MLDVVRNALNVNVLFCNGLIKPLRGVLFGPKEEGIPPLTVMILRFPNLHRPDLGLSLLPKSYLSLTVLIDLITIINAFSELLTKRQQWIILQILHDLLPPHDLTAFNISASSNEVKSSLAPLFASATGSETRACFELAIVVLPLLAGQAQDVLLGTLDYALEVTGTGLLYVLTVD